MTDPKTASVIVTAAFVIARDEAGVTMHYRQSDEPVQMREVDAQRLLELEAVRLVDDADASVPTGDERNVDEGEAGGTDAAEPSFSDDDADEDASEEGPSKDDLIAQLDAAGVEYDKRWGVKRLAEALDGAADDR